MVLQEQTDEGCKNLLTKQGKKMQMVYAQKYGIKITQELIYIMQDKKL